MADQRKKWVSLSSSTTEIPSIHEVYAKPLQAGLWCLYVSKHKLGIDYLNYEDIEKILREYLDVPISAVQIKKAFARAGRKIIKGTAGEGYKISRNPGEEYIRGLNKDKTFNINIVYINPDKPRTAKKNFEDLIKSIPQGTLSICDPYYGLKTLDVLEVFAKYHKEIKFLTARVGGGEKVSTLNHAVGQFKKEFGDKVEIKLTSSSDLHDRYILAKDHFFIIGHGIKDLGSKESLIVGVHDRYGKDIRKMIEHTFGQRWAQAQTL